LDPLDTDKHVGFHRGLQTSHLFLILKCCGTDNYPHTDSVIICGTGILFSGSIKNVARRHTCGRALLKRAQSSKMISRKRRILARKFGQCLLLANFCPPQKKGCSKQTGSFPSAGKPHVVTSHTSPTSLICIVHNWELHCLWYNSWDQMDWCNTLMCSSEWLSGTEILVNICQRKEVNCKRQQSKHYPSLGLSVYHKFSLKSMVHNRGHILAAAQVVMFNGYLRNSDKHP